MDGIIFDVDGTLWDSTKEVADSWNQAILDHSDLPADITAERLKQEFGKPLEEIMISLYPDMDPKKREELSYHFYVYENEYMHTAPCKRYEGLCETIKELSKKWKLFIVSNCQSGYIEGFLDNTGLESYITDFTCPGDTGKMKGDNIKLIVEKHQLKQPIYVGDTLGDARASAYAGVPFVYASYGFGEVDEYAAKIEKLTDLQKMDLNEMF